MLTSKNAPVGKHTDPEDNVTTRGANRSPFVKAPEPKPFWQVLNFFGSMTPTKPIEVSPK